MYEDERIVADHVADKRASTQFKERRFDQWNVNYELYRDKVRTNRLTQRQPVNVPIMRDTIQNWISKIDEPPLLSFESRSRDNKSVDGEIVLNELWNYFFDLNKLDLLDNLDKKIVGLQGRSFKKMGWANSFVFCDIIDPYDVDVSPMVNPLDLNSAGFVIHKNIFKPLRVILANPKYSDAAKYELKQYLQSTKGILKSKEVEDEYQKRQDRLKALGAYNFDDEEFRASDVMVELNESYKLRWSNEKGRMVRHLDVIAMDKAVLYKKPMKDAIGIESLPIISWADDPDLNDIWCDGKGDSVRTVNKVVNTYFSQDLENRAYRNFGMYFFNTMGGEFKPAAFDPKPFGMYGVPGNPQEVVQQMRIEPLGDTMQSIEFLKNMIQNSVAQTATERGVDSVEGTTLGEVKLNFQQSQGRNEVTAKNYRRAWKEAGLLFYELLNANASGQMTLYKKGSDGEYRSKTIFPSDWKNPKGYECKVVYKSEKEADDNFALQKAQYVRTAFPNNPVALKISRQKELELLGWSQEEIDQVIAYEEQAAAPSNVQTDPALGAPEEQAPEAEAQLAPFQPSEEGLVPAQ